MSKSMWRTKRWGQSGALLLMWGGFFGCAVEPGTMLEIVAVPAFTEDCTLTFDATLIQTSGFFDPTVADEFVLPLTLRNHMVDENYDEITGPGDDNLRPRANSVTLLGFDVCFFLQNDPNLDVDQMGPKSGALVNCSALPDAQQRFIVAQGVIPTGDATSGTILSILNQDDLRGLFGQSFTPGAIPIRGAYFDDYDGDGQLGHQEPVRFSRLSENPASPFRSPAWGNFPDTRSVVVVVQLRAVGKLQTGWQVSSQWLHYPIEISVGTVRDACGPLSLTQCNNPCGDAAQTCEYGPTPPTPYELRQCALDTPGVCGGVCSGSNLACAGFAFSGPMVDLADSCRPAQGAGDLTCVVVDGCLVNGSPP